MSTESANMFTKTKRFSKMELESFRNPVLAVTATVVVMIEEAFASGAKNFTIDAEHVGDFMTISLSGVVSES